MTPKQEIAKLRKDIKLATLCVEHWVRMRDDRQCGEVPEAHDCAFCQAYLCGITCTGCPIDEFTNGESCRDTPYDLAHGEFAYGDGCEWRHASTAMTNFLRRIKRNLQAKLRRWT